MVVASAIFEVLMIDDAGELSSSFTPGGKVESICLFDLVESVMVDVLDSKSD